MELTIAIIMWVVITGMLSTYSWKAGWRLKTVLIILGGILLIFVAATVAVFIPRTDPIMMHSGWVTFIVQWGWLYRLIKHPRKSNGEDLSGEPL